MRAEGYRISDEPRPGTLSRLVVDPVWPLLAAMLAGSWLALPWFAVNAAAVGSPTRRREVAWIVGGVAVSVLSTLAVMAVADGLPRWGVRALLVLLVAWRLGVAYVLFELQRGPVELFRWHGGRVQSGLAVAIAGAFAGPALFRAMGEPWGQLVGLVLG